MLHSELDGSNNPTTLGLLLTGFFYHTTSTPFTVSDCIQRALKWYKKYLQEKA